jgi:hypothetical protein
MAPTGGRSPWECTVTEPDAPDAAGRPSSRLVARVGALDRSDRFGARLLEIEHRAARRAVGHRALRALTLATIAGVGCLVPLVAAAVRGVAGPSGLQLLAGGVAGLALALAAGIVAGIVARRRGAEAWDWHHQRYVLLGNPAREVRDADRPGRATRGPLEP